MTPRTLVHAARIAVAAIGAWSAAGYVQGELNASDAGQLALALGIAVLLAVPRQRAADLLGMVAIWLTLCEFMAASRTGHFALWRWAVVLAALATILIMARVPRVRAQARTNPWRSMREDDRRDQPGAAWCSCCAVGQGSAALTNIEGRARRIAAASNRLT